MEDLHRRLVAHLAERGIHVAVYYCPHHDADGCACRKPNPGLLLRAAQERGIDLAQSWMIGDTERDMGAGRAAGCREVRVSREAPLRAAVDQILARH